MNNPGQVNALIERRDWVLAQGGWYRVKLPLGGTSNSSGKPPISGGVTRQRMIGRIPLEIDSLITRVTLGWRHISLLNSKPILALPGTVVAMRWGWSSNHQRGSQEPRFDRCLSFMISSLFTIHTAADGNHCGRRTLAIISDITQSKSPRLSGLYSAGVRSHSLDSICSSQTSSHYRSFLQLAWSWQWFLLSGRCCGG